MGAPQWIVLLVAIQRLCELILAKRNTGRLLEAGGIEYGKGHYPWFIALHTAWLVSLFLLVPADSIFHPALLVVFIVLQAGRVWVVATLGRFWTTRVISLPGAPLIRKGPYRWIRHPNYLIVALEIAVLPLVFGAWELSAIFTIFNLPLLAWRIRIEERALLDRRVEPRS